MHNITNDFQYWVYEDFFRLHTVYNIYTHLSRAKLQEIVAGRRAGGKERLAHHNYTPVAPDQGARTIERRQGARTKSMHQTSSTVRKNICRQRLTMFGRNGATH